MSIPLAESDWAMTASGLAAVCDEVERRGLRIVVECGSGHSTLVLAQLLRERGGRLVTLEHDRTWADRVGAALDAGGLASTARVLLAPLEPQPLARGDLGWYSRRSLRALPRRIDLLLVDGPPAGAPGKEQSRYPALPVLADRLGPQSIVVLDDIDRAGERTVLEAWERETAFRFELRHSDRIAVGRVVAIAAPASPRR